MPCWAHPHGASTRGRPVPACSFAKRAYVRKIAMTRRFGAYDRDRRAPPHARPAPCGVGPEATRLDLARFAIEPRPASCRFTTSPTPAPVATARRCSEDGIPFLHRGRACRDPGISPPGPAPRFDCCTIPDPAPVTPRSLPNRQDPCDTALNFLSFHEWGCAGPRE